MTKRIENLQVGDKFYSRKFSTKSIRILTVEKVTKTQIVADNGNRYNRATGRIIGSCYNYTPEFGCVITDEIMEEFKLQEKRNSVKYIAEKHLSTSLRVNRLSDEAVTEIYDVFNKHLG